MNEIYNFRKSNYIKRNINTNTKTFEYVPLKINKIKFDQTKRITTNQFSNFKDNSVSKSTIRIKVDANNKKSFNENSINSEILNFELFNSKNFTDKYTRYDIRTQNYFYKPSTAEITLNRPKERFKKGQNQLIYERLLEKIKPKQKEKKANSCIYY